MRYPGPAPACKLPRVVGVPLLHVPPLVESVLFQHPGQIPSTAPQSVVSASEETPRVSSYFLLPLLKPWLVYEQTACVRVTHSHSRRAWLRSPPYLKVHSRGAPGSSPHCPVVLPQPHVQLRCSLLRTFRAQPSRKQVESLLTEFL